MRSRVLALVAVLATAGCPAAVELQTPVAPDNVVAVAGNGIVIVSFDDVAPPEGESAGAVTYTLYTSINDEIDGNSARVEDVASPFVDAEVVNGVRTFYAVTASVGGKESAFSRTVSALPDVGATAPGAVPNVTAEGGPDGVTIRFSPSVAVLGYTLYRGRASGVDTENGEAIVGIQSGYVDHDVLVGEPWFYVVTSTSTDGGESPISREVTAARTGDVVDQPPAAPANVAAVAGNGQVTLTWNDVGGASSYNVYFRAQSGVTSQNGTARANVTSPFLHTGLTNGAPVFYVVTAENAAGESAPSSEVSATPSDDAESAPDAVNDLSAVAGDGLVTLSWTNVAGATSYKVFRAGSAGVSTSSQLAGEVAGGPVDDTGIPNGTAVFYRVAAVGAGGQSALSNEVSATPTAVAPANHGSVSASLPANVSGIVLVENTTDGGGLFSVQVLSGTPDTGTGIDGLSVTLSGPASGPLTAGGGGSYSATAPGPIAPGTYGVTVAGAVNGTFTVIINDTPTCAITAPAQSSTQPSDTDLTIAWTSLHSDQVIVKFEDVSGTVTYPAVGPPDPHGVILPGTDLVFPGPIDLLLSAAWKLNSAPPSSTAVLLVFGDCHTTFNLQ